MLYRSVHGLVMTTRSRRVLRVREAITVRATGTEFVIAQTQRSFLPEDRAWHPSFYGSTRVWMNQIAR